MVRIRNWHLSDASNAATLLPWSRRTSDRRLSLGRDGALGNSAIPRRRSFERCRRNDHHHRGQNRNRMRGSRDDDKACRLASAARNIGGFGRGERAECAGAAWPGPRSTDCARNVTPSAEMDKVQMPERLRSVPSIAGWISIRSATDCAKGSWLVIPICRHSGSHAKMRAASCSISDPSRHRSVWLTIWYCPARPRGSGP